MFISTTSSDWTWIDALNMAMPSFDELGKIKNDTTHWSRMFDLYNHTKRAEGGAGLYNATDHLWFRDKAPWQLPRSSGWRLGLFILPNNKRLAHARNAGSPPVEARVAQVSDGDATDLGSSGPDPCLDSASCAQWTVVL